MNKKLLTAAVGAALIIGPTVATAGDVEVGLNLHFSLDRAENGTTERGFLSSNDSKFVLKGKKDVGDGMTAIFQMMTGPFFADAGTDGLSGTLQDTYAGIQSAWGTVKLGRHNTPSKDLSRALDYFSNRVGDTRSVIGRNASNASRFDPRAGNMVRYESPKIAGGLGISAVYGTDEGGPAPSGTGAATPNQDIRSVGVRWDKGPLFVGGSWHRNDTGVLAEPHEDGLRFGVKYNFGMFEARGFYEVLKNLSGTPGADRDSFGVGGAFNMGKNRVAAQYYTTSKVDTSAVDNGGETMAVGYDYAQSKEVRFYVMYAKTKNDAGTSSFNNTTGATTGGHSNFLTAASNGDTVSTWSVGTIFNF